MNRDFDKEIPALEAKIEEKRLEMEKVKNTFILAAVGFLKSWYWEQTERLVKSEADKTKALGSEKLAKLKAAVRELQGNAEGIAAEFLGDASLWWHLRSGDQKYYLRGNRAPDHLEKALGLAAGMLAAPLEKYGYVEPATSDRGWREWDRSGNHHPPNARPYYPHHLDWSSEMRRLMGEYDKLLSLASREAGDLESTKRAKAEDEAAGLWDKA
jgi:hypothetical protein